MTNWHTEIFVNEPITDRLIGNIDRSVIDFSFVSVGAESWHMVDTDHLAGILPKLLTD